MSEGSRKAIAALGKTYTAYITVHGTYQFTTIAELELITCILWQILLLFYQITVCHSLWNLWYLLAAVINPCMVFGSRAAVSVQQ